MPALRLRRPLAWLALFIGGALFAVNLYGLTQSIRPQHFAAADLRFQGDQPTDFQSTLAALERLPEESEQAFAERVTQVIAQGIAHINWLELEDRQKYHQLVPIWENYFLYLMGLLSPIPEYQKYHFMDYQRSLKRGIGVCGDTSMILSQVLEKNGIASDILVFPGHVVVAANINDQEQLFDADFGVSLPYGREATQASLDDIVARYAAQGYGDDEPTLRTIYQGRYLSFADVRHFAAKKYYFEKLAYWLKWPLPIALMLFPVYLFKRNRAISEST